MIIANQFYWFGKLRFEILFQKIFAPSYRPYLTFFNCLPLPGHDTITLLNALLINSKLVIPNTTVFENFYNYLPLPGHDTTNVLNVLLIISKLLIHNTIFFDVILPFCLHNTKSQVDVGVSFFSQYFHNKRLGDKSHSTSIHYFCH